MITCQTVKQLLYIHYGTTVICTRQEPRGPGAPGHAPLTVSAVQRFANWWLAIGSD